MHWNANRARLVCHRPGDGLSYPPGGVGGELETASVLKLADCANQSDVTFLHQIQQCYAAADVLFSHRHDQSQVCACQMFLCVLGQSLDFVEVRVREIFIEREIGDGAAFV